MMNITKLKEHFTHDVRKIFANKFIIVLTLLIVYFGFASWHFGLKEGFLVMILTWSFFVLATPIPDGGIILDLPIRYFTGVKMVMSEIFVWIIAISINIINILFNNSIYNKTVILTIFRDIIVKPIPYILIILLSFIGTFFTLYVGDEIYDGISQIRKKTHQKNKNKLNFILLISIIAFVIVLYELLLKHLGVRIL